MAALSTGLFLTATAAQADIPMFLVISLMKLNALPILVVVVLIEAVAIRWIYGFDGKQSVLTSLIANGISLLLGIILYPILGGFLYPIVAPLVLDSAGNVVAVELIVTMIGVSIVDTAVELPVIAHIRKVRITLRAGVIFLAANVLGVAIMAASMATYDDLIEPPIPEQEIARLEARYADEIAFMQRIYDQVDADFADVAQLAGPEWDRLQERLQEEAIQYDFLRLTVVKTYSNSIVFGHGGEDGLHSTAARRGEGTYRRENIEIWRTMSQGGVWYYVYDIRESRQPRTLLVRAWFDPV